LLPVYSDPSSPFAVMHKLADDLNWLGDDLAALRTFDVLRAVDMINEWPSFANTGTRIYAHGRQGVYGEFAAALDKRIKSIEVEKGIGSFAKLVRTRIYDSKEIKSVILHGMLRHFDLPDLKKWGATKH
ncbi:MAG: hypothetical protein ABI254_01970, partial [Chthoniobacterales bacterium]